MQRDVNLTQKVKRVKKTSRNNSWGFSLNVFFLCVYLLRKLKRDYFEFSYCICVESHWLVVQTFGKNSFRLHMVNAKRQTHKKKIRRKHH